MLLLYTIMIYIIYLFIIIIICAHIIIIMIRIMLFANSLDVFRFCFSRAPHRMAGPRSTRRYLIRSGQRRIISIRLNGGGGLQYCIPTYIIISMCVRTILFYCVEEDARRRRVVYTYYYYIIPCERRRREDVNDRSR